MEKPTGLFLTNSFSSRINKIVSQVLVYWSRFYKNPAKWWGCIKYLLRPEEAVSPNLVHIILLGPECNFTRAKQLLTGFSGYRLRQDGEDAGERRAEVDVPHLLPGHHHAARRQVPPPEGTDRDAPLRQGKKPSITIWSGLPWIAASSCAIHPSKSGQTLHSLATDAHELVVTACKVVHLVAKLLELESLM